MTRICIFGAGAIGGYVGAALHEAGAEVALSPAARIWKPSGRTDWDSRRTAR